MHRQYITGSLVSLAALVILVALTYVLVVDGRLATKLAIRLPHVEDPEEDQCKDILERGFL